MTRTFLTLAVLSHLFLATAYGMGLLIDDPTVRDVAVQRWVSYHMLTGLAALIFATLVHAIVLTYFMGTGRWLEETTQAYQLPPQSFLASRKLKYQTIVLQTLCLLLLITTGALGGAADPASAVGFQGFLGLSPGLIHQLCAATMWATTFFVNLFQHYALTQNGEIVHSVLSEVQRIRQEHGLSV